MSPVASPRNDENSFACFAGDFSEEAEKEFANGSNVPTDESSVGTFHPLAGIFGGVLMALTTPRNDEKKTQTEVCATFSEEFSWR